MTSILAKFLVYVAFCRLVAVSYLYYGSVRVGKIRSKPIISKFYS